MNVHIQEKLLEDTCKNYGSYQRLKGVSLLYWILN